MTPKMQQFKELKSSLNQVLNRNKGKIVYSLFLMTILETVITSVLMLPILKHSVSGTMNYLLSAITFAIFLLFQFGFATILLRMTRDEFVTLGFLFYGFKKPKLSFGVVFGFLVLAGLVLVSSRFLYFSVFENIINNLFDSVKETVENEPSIQQTFNMLQNANAIDTINNATETSKLLLQITVPTILFAAIYFFGILIPFAFTFHFKLDNPKKSVLFAMKKSLLLIFSNFNYFRLVGFSLSCAGKKLIITIIIGFIISFLSSAKSLGVLVMILEFTYFLNAYAALIRIYVSIPVFYYGMTKEQEVGQILNIEA